MHVFKHPKYYKELRKRNKSDQAISSEGSTDPEERAPSDKRQAPAGGKPQALSIKLLDYLPLIKFYGVKGEGLN